MLAMVPAYFVSQSAFACDTPEANTIYLDAPSVIAPAVQDGSQANPYYSTQDAVDRLESDPTITRLCVGNTRGSAIVIDSPAGPSTTIEGWARAGRAPIVGILEFNGVPQQLHEWAIEWQGNSLQELTVTGVNVGGGLRSTGGTSVNINQSAFEQRLAGTGVVEVSAAGAVNLSQLDVFGMSVPRLVLVHDSGDLVMADIDAELVAPPQGSRLFEGYFLGDVRLENSSLVVSNGGVAEVVNLILPREVHIDSTYITNGGPGNYTWSGTGVSIQAADLVSLSQLEVVSPGDTALRLEGHPSGTPVTIFETKLREFYTTGIDARDVSIDMQRSFLESGLPLQSGTALALHEGSLYMEDSFVALQAGQSLGTQAVRLSGSADAELQFNTFRDWNWVVNLIGLDGEALSGSVSARGNLVVASAPGHAAMYATGAGGQAVSLDSGENFFSGAEFGWNVEADFFHDETNVSDANPEPELNGSARLVDPSNSPELDCNFGDVVGTVPNLAWPYQRNFLGFVIDPDTDYTGHYRGGPDITPGAWECNLVNALGHVIPRPIIAPNPKWPGPVLPPEPPGKPQKPLKPLKPQKPGKL